MPAQKNRLYYGDNLDVLRGHVADECIDLIYLDPPFNSNRSYNVLFKSHGQESEAQIEAFDDTWHWSQQAEEQYAALVTGGGAPVKVAEAIEAMRKLLGTNDVLAYMVMMTARLVELHRVLKPTGSLYLHCDPTASHYLKVMLDAIFGATHFQNEFIWYYSGGGASKQRWARKHDVLLFYTKGSTWTFNADAVRVPYKWTAGQKRADGSGRDLTAGKLADDVWEEHSLMPWADERLGYPTQKPLALLERVIAASSNADDVVLDPFCGCGTTVDAAQKLGRRWVGIDVSYLAVDLIDKRLRHKYGAAVAGTYDVHGIPTDLVGAHALFASNPFDFERWAVSLVSGQPNEKQVGDKGIDGKIRFVVGPERVGVVLVSVKGGKTVSPTVMRDLEGTVTAERAEMGLLITMDAPTRGVREVADQSGSYEFPGGGTKFPRLQVVSVADLLAHKPPKIPTAILPYVKAKPYAGEQMTLG